MDDIDNLQYEGNKYLENLMYVNKRICKITFKKHYENLIDEILIDEIYTLDDISRCKSLTFCRLDDYQFIFNCTFVGKNVILNFEYQDGWLRHVSKNNDNPTTMSECQSINKFCNELITLLIV